mgnify:CR=1 FL=1
MHDAVGAVEVAETAKDGFCNLSEDVDAYGAELARHPVQSTIAVCQFLLICRRWGSRLPHVHVLHAHDNIARVVLEGAIEVDNVGRVALVHDAQLSHDAFPYFVLRFDVYDLRLSAPLDPVVGPARSVQRTFLAMMTLVAAC